MSGLHERCRSQIGEAKPEDRAEGPDKDQQLDVEQPLESIDILEAISLEIHRPQRDAIQAARVQEVSRSGAKVLMEVSGQAAEQRCGTRGAPGSPRMTPQ